MYGHLQQELQNGLRHEPWYSPWANLLTAVKTINKQELSPRESECPSIKSGLAYLRKTAGIIQPSALQAFFEQTCLRPLL